MSTPEEGAALAALAAEVALLRAAGQENAQEGPGVWDWTSADAQAGREAWAVLVAWVREVLGSGPRGLDVMGTSDALAREGKGIRRILPCWYRHPRAVWELSWLCQEWHVQYRSQHGTPARTGDWHDRYLPGVINRLDAVLYACREGHTEPYRRHAAIDDEAAQAAAIEAYLAPRA